MNIDRRERCENGHLLCKRDTMCAGFLTGCPDAHNDDMGRVSTDKRGETLHTECRRQIRLYGEVF